MTDEYEKPSIKSASSEEASYLDALLDKSETKAGKKALHKLYDLNCNRSYLGGHLIYLTRDEPIVIETTMTDGEPITIPIRYMDSIDPEALMDGFNLQKLKQIGEAAKKLKEYIENLKHTELVKHLVAYGLIENNDLLITSSKSSAIDNSDDPFYGLLNLHKLAKEFRPSNRPDYTRHLTKIYLHIRERTNTWHDKEVADILNDLLPDVQPPYDEFNLKQWRQRHNLKDKK